jgi:hypothetical protein
MLTPKSWFLIIGVVLCCLGFMCLPAGYGANPKRDLSLFSNFADLGAFLQAGIVLLGAGLIVIGLTLLGSAIARLIRRNP